MLALAAFAAIGISTPAEPWVNTLMGVSHGEAIAQLKLDEGTFSTKDGKIAIELTGDPTNLVWAMNPEDYVEEFSLPRLLDDLGFDGKSVVTTNWERVWGPATVIKNLKGLKEGWIPFVGSYDIIFAGPEIAQDFDLTGPGVRTTAYAAGLSKFLKTPTWQGAVAAYGKAQHLERTNGGYYAITWRGQGMVTEFTLAIDPELVDASMASNPVKVWRTTESPAGRLDFSLKSGMKDWKQAFRTVGLDPKDAVIHTSKEITDYATFSKVLGLPKGWTVEATYVDGSVSTIAIAKPIPQTDMPSGS